MVRAGRGSEQHNAMTDESSNTGKKQVKGGFVKGDPRINRNGRPKSFDQLRTLAQEIAHEVARDKSGHEVIVSGKRATVAEMILRQMATDPKRQQQFIEVAFGKVPQPVEHTGADGDVIRVKLTNDD